MSSDAELLLEQLQSLITDPDSFALHKCEVIDLSRRAILALEEPFEIAN